jgi:hypothetical protein
MKIIRWAAVLVTILMALMNLGTVFATGDQRPGTGLLVLGLVAGVAGIAAAVGLVRQASWGPAAVTGVGAINAVLAVIALTQDMEGAIVGLAVSALGLVLGAATLLARPAPVIA